MSAGDDDTFIATTAAWLRANPNARLVVVPQDSGRLPRLRRLLWGMANRVLSPVLTWGVRRG